MSLQGKVLAVITYAYIPRGLEVCVEEKWIDVVRKHWGIAKKFLLCRKL